MVRPSIAVLRALLASTAVASSGLEAAHAGACPRDGGYEVPATAAFGPAQPAWTFGGTGTFYGGPTQCGAFRTPAGTTLVTVANSSTVIEVAPSGAVLSTWVAPVNLARAVRYRQVGGQWVGP